MILRVQHRSSGIPTSSMADLAFLLLIFFLAATVIDVDTGIGLTLPEYTNKPAPVSEGRFAAILINADNDILLDNVMIPLSRLKGELEKRIRDKIDLPANKKLVVSIKSDRKTKYGNYIALLDQVKLAYFETRDEYANSKYGEKFSKLNKEEHNAVKKAIPIIISIAEPEAVN